LGWRTRILHTAWKRGRARWSGCQACGEGRAARKCYHVGSADAFVVGAQNVALPSRRLSWGRPARTCARAQRITEENLKDLNSVSSVVYQELFRSLLRSVRRRGVRHGDAALWGIRTGGRGLVRTECAAGTSGAIRASE